MALFLTPCILTLLGLPRVPSVRAGLGTDIAAAGCGAASEGLISSATAEVAVDPHTLDFHAVQGEDLPPSQSIAVQCYERDEFYAECGGSLSSNQDWLLIDRKNFYGVDSVEVNVDPAGLEPGTYEGKIHVSYALAFDDEDVNVELVVE